MEDLIVFFTFIGTSMLGCVCLIRLLHSAIER